MVHRQFAAAVDAGEHAVLGVEPKSSHRSHGRNDAPSSFPELWNWLRSWSNARLGGAAVRRHALGAVHTTKVLPERELAEVDLLLADVLHRLAGARSLPLSSTTRRT